MTHAVPTRLSADLVCASRPACARGCSWQTLRMLCRRGRHGGQLHFQIGQRFAPAFDELTQHSKLRGSFIAVRRIQRSEEHTSELQSLMRSSYAVFCLKKKNHATHTYLEHDS